MATIALYADKVNQMPGLVRNIKKSVWDYKLELSLLKDMALKVDQGTCCMEEVLRSIRASAQVQEEKAASLEILCQEVEGFIEGVVHIDEEAAEAIRRRKEEFYELHPYLKPACEKGDWERFCDGCGEWCREHWKAVVTVALVAAAVVLVCTGVGGPLGAILLGACKGIVAGAAIGGLLGGLSNVAAGRPFLEGLEEGALSGALLGAFFGGLGGLGQVLGSFPRVVGALGPAARAIPVVFRTSAKVALGMFGFDLLALGTSLVSPDDLLVQLNRKLHQSGPYNAFQFTVTALAAFSGGFLKGMEGQRLTMDGSKFKRQPYKGTRNPDKDFVNGKGISTLNKHAGKHGYTSPEVYLKDARNFLEKKPTSTMQSFTSDEGTYFRYDTATNEFGIINEYGGISTYFKPESGMAYWLEQIEKYAPK